MASGSLSSVAGLSVSKGSRASNSSCQEGGPFNTHKSQDNKRSVSQEEIPNMQPQDVVGQQQTSASEL